jgi:hypothetical protein
MSEGARQADKELARGSWRQFVTKTRAALASLGIALVFTVRAYACDPDESGGPLDFEWYGEHCGPGHGTDGEPIDEQDELCKKHDAAYRALRGEGETGDGKND